MAKLRAALLGLGDGGRQVADVLLNSSWCELVSIASRRSDQLDALGASSDVRLFNDYRSAIVSQPIDVLFVAIPPFHRFDYLKLAIEQRTAVWMLSPPLPRYDQLLETVEMFDEAGLPITSARVWNGESALDPRHFGIERVGQVYMVEGRVSTCASEDHQWRGDSAKAGGGVLLDRGYSIIHAIVQLMGIPPSVFSLLGQTPTGTRNHRDTEDNAAVVCRYDEDALAMLTACRTSGPEEWSIRIRGTEGTFTADLDTAVLRDHTGEQELWQQPRSPHPFTCQIDSFLSAVATQAETIPNPLRDELETMAVMQAAYLSARTGQPETPQAITQMHRAVR